MDKILEQFTKMVNKPFIDSLYLIFGILFLFIINLLYDFNIESIQNFDKVNTIILTIIFIVISYYIGRMLRLISSIWSFLFWSIFKKNKKKKIIIFFLNIKKQINELPEEVLYIPNEMAHAKVEEIINENERVKNNFDRNIINSIFINLNIGLIITLSIIKFHYILVVLLLILTLLEMKEKIKLSKMEADSVKHYIQKNKIDK